MKTNDQWPSLANRPWDVRPLTNQLRKTHDRPNERRSDESASFLTRLNRNFAHRRFSTVTDGRKEGRKQPSEKLDGKINERGISGFHGTGGAADQKSFDRGPRERRTATVIASWARQENPLPEERQNPRDWIAVGLSERKSPFPGGPGTCVCKYASTQVRILFLCFIDMPIHSCKA